MVDDIIASVKEDIVSPTVPPASSVQTGNPPVTNSKTALQEFRNLVGTDTPSDLSYNIGIYQRALQQQRRCRILCLLTSYLSTILLWLQIVLAAAITGLSAYKETSPVALTTLGAFNTVVAGYVMEAQGASQTLIYSFTDQCPQRVVFSPGKRAKESRNDTAKHKTNTRL